MRARPLRGVLKEYSSTFNVLLHVCDWVWIALTGWLAHWIYLGGPSLPGFYEAAILVGVLFAALVFPRFGVYRAWRGASLIEELRLITLSWATVVAALVFIAFVIKMGETYSRGWALTWVALAWFGLISSRILLRRLLTWMRARGFNQRRIVIVGTDELGREVAARISTAPWTGLQIAGFFCDPDGSSETRSPEFPVIGSIEDLPAYVEREPVDQVWFALPLREEDKVRELLYALRHATVDIRFVPDLFGLRLINHSVTDVAGLPVMNLSMSPMQGFNRLIKGLEDRILAMLILVLVSPLLVVIAIGVKLSSPGPVLFKQTRHGWDGREIRIYKFRTMVEHQEEDGRVTQARRNDGRVTPFGAFLRRTSMDELPQFVNVLQGRISIVGPRPHALEHNEFYKEHVDYYMQRHKVKPGITGWAQINGYRGRTDTLEKMRKRVEHDLYYIENWSVWFDLKIILLTVFKGFVGRNVY
jgi:Undecaprenyl-phosphate glucose phosphotransferase